MDTKLTREGYLPEKSQLDCVPLPHQVIYKKFNIACPLETFGNYSVTEPMSDDTCTAKFFTINHEVRLYLSEFDINSHACSFRLHMHIEITCGWIMLQLLATHIPRFMHFQARDINLLLCLQTAYTIPILAFAFVCHPEVLPVYTELSK